MEKIKILCLLKENRNGSDYHRMQYPLDKLNGQLLEDREIEVTYKVFDKDVLKEAESYNILVYNWDVTGLSVQDIGHLQSLGVKILYSIDDYWQFSELHPYYNNDFIKQYIEGRVKQHLLSADGVMVTTERLALNCKPYADNIAILPNFLNPEDFKVEKSKSDKLRLGLLGSISHYPDFLMFKQVLNRLAKNKKIVDNCQFVICGYVQGDKYWEEIVSMFKKKKNIDLVIKPALPVNEYINLFSDIDVCLCPLEYTEFNLNKSALRLMECAITNTLPIGSSLYSSKELQGIVVAETPQEYEQTILKLLDRDYYNQVLKYITEINLKDADYNLRIENTKAVIGALYNEDLSTKLDNIQIWNIKYKEEQPTEYPAILNTKRDKGWRFEYNPLLDKLEEIKSSPKDYFSLLSWKYSSKTGLIKNILFKELRKQKYNDFDIINLNRRYWKSTQEYLNFSYKQHPNLENLLSKTLNNLGYDINNLDKNNVNYNHSNFYLMKKEYMIDYIENWIIPSLEYLETDIWYEVNVDAQYKSGLTSEQLLESAGVEFYNFVTFILERLIIFYMYEKNLKVKNLF